VPGRGGMPIANPARFKRTEHVLRGRFLPGQVERRRRGRCIHEALCDLHKINVGFTVPAPFRTCICVDSVIMQLGGGASVNHQCHARNPVEEGIKVWPEPKPIPICYEKNGFFLRIIRIFGRSSLHHCFLYTPRSLFDILISQRN